MCRCFKAWRSPLVGAGTLFVSGSGRIPTIG
jgi:hypothetical protein